MSKVDKDAKPVVAAALTCPNCNWTIFSRAGHDFHSCNCGGITVDGGFAYLRVLWQTELVPEPPEAFGLQVNASRRELYDDWNLGKNQYGLLEPEAILVKVPLPEAE